MYIIIVVSGACVMLPSPPPLPPLPSPPPVPGLLEHEAIPGISTSRPIGSKKKTLGSGDAVVTVETVLSEISSILDVLQENFVEPQITSQIIRQVRTNPDSIPK